MRQHVGLKVRYKQPSPPDCEFCKYCGENELNSETNPPNSDNVNIIISLIIAGTKKIINLLSAEKRYVLVIFDKHSAFH